MYDCCCATADYIIKQWFVQKLKKRNMQVKYSLGTINASLHEQTAEASQQQPQQIHSFPASVSTSFVASRLSQTPIIICRLSGTTRSRVSRTITLER